jgi:hypothetical protein
VLIGYHEKSQQYVFIGSQRRHGNAALCPIVKFLTGWIDLQSTDITGGGLFVIDQ